MSIFEVSRGTGQELRKSEVVAAVAEVTAIFTIFIIAFTGRSAFGDTVRQVLTVLSLIAGSLGALAGMVVLARGVLYGASRLPRLALGAFMTFIGIYTVVHVL